MEIMKIRLHIDSHSLTRLNTKFITMTQIISFLKVLYRILRKQWLLMFPVFILLNYAFLHSVRKMRKDTVIKNNVRASPPVTPEEVYLSEDEIADALRELQRQLTEIKTPCHHLIRMGGIVTCECHTKKCSADGAKLLCFDEDVKPLPRACRALSFGIGFDLSFDLTLARYGCHVTAFDPTNINMTDTVHNGTVHALTIGLDDRNHQYALNLTFDRVSTEVHVASFMTYGTVLKMLGDPKVDILKIDIEGAEWRVLRQIFTSHKAKELLKDVKQILLEAHLDFLLKRVDLAIIYEEAVLILEIFKSLERLGFYLAAYELNETEQKFFAFRDLNIPIYREVTLIKRSL